MLNIGILNLLLLALFDDELVFYYRIYYDREIGALLFYDICVVFDPVVLRKGLVNEDIEVLDENVFELDLFKKRLA